MLPVAIAALVKLLAVLQSPERLHIMRCVTSVSTRIAALAILAAMSFTCSANGANRKPDIQSADYSLWHSITGHQLSPDAKWISYTISKGGAASGGNTFLKRLGGTDEISFDDSVSGSFSPDSGWYAGLTSGSTLQIVNLHSGELKEIERVNAFVFSDNSESIIFDSHLDPKEGTRLKSVNVLDLATFQRQSFTNVAEYKYNAKLDALVYIVDEVGERSVRLLQRSSPSQEAQVLTRTSSQMLSLAVSKHGNAVSFIERTQDSGRSRADFKDVLHHYAIGGVTSEGAYLGAHSAIQLPNNTNVSRDWLRLTDDGSMVLYRDRRTNQTGEGSLSAPVADGAKVNVWHYLDEKVYSDKSRWIEADSFYTWQVSSGFRHQLQDGKKTRQFLSLTGDQKHALILSRRSADSGVGHDEGLGSLSALNLLDGSQDRILDTDNLPYPFTVVVSPRGDYIAYFKDSDWWVYDLSMKKRVNVSSATPFPVVDRHSDMAHAPRPFGFAGWTDDDTHLIFYDEFDIWVVKPDGMGLTRVTSGRDSGTRHRLQRSSRQISQASDGIGIGTAYRSEVVRLRGEAVVSLFNERTKRSGAATLDADYNLDVVAYGDMNVYSVELSESGDILTYLKSRFDTPPQLVSVDRESGVSRVEFQSNPHHYEFSWGWAELVNYKTESREKLQGILYYPTNFSAGNQYPMIVHVYEKQSQDLHSYINPSATSFDLSVPTYLADGYFVFKPDISFRLDDPGISALESVSAAVSSVIETGYIDKNAIGLIGASWGGYLTSFLVSQTDMFSAAVAGSASTDLVSLYLSVEPNNGMPVMWRFEEQQVRIPTPFHVDQNPYLRNSTLHNAANISTPLLSWFGAKDEMLNWQQGMELHLLMRKMKKEHIFLVYPDEPHNIGRTDIRNALDLNTRIRSWFDYHLKGAIPPEWISTSSGTN